MTYKEPPNHIEVNCLAIPRKFRYISKQVIYYFGILFFIFGNVFSQKVVGKAIVKKSYVILNFKFYPVPS